MKTIDLRSDTVTQPTAAMKEAMLNAKLGDDVFGDDPSVRALEEKTAAMLGKEAALFVPTGTMGNQICIRAHTQPGDEMICSDNAHIYIYEGGGFAALSGLSVACVKNESGIMKPSDVKAAIRAEGSLSHYPETSLICLENTANRGGGTYYSLEAIQEIGAIARERNLAYHLDGARMFNAVIASGISAKDMVAPFDSVSLCLSKALGCPVGSVIVGTRTFINRCHRFRKMFGGGMRQAGILAAAGSYALDHHIERLADDHGRAKNLAEALSTVDGYAVNLESVKSNMVYVDVTKEGRSAPELVEALAKDGVMITAVNDGTIRAVTHLQIDDVGIEAAIGGFKKFVA
jgi:threonine aldolase